MRANKIFILVAFFIVLFGCIGPFEPKPTGEEQIPQQEKNKTPMLTITSDKNYTISYNKIDNLTIGYNMNIVAETANYTYTPYENVFVYFAYVGEDGGQADAILIKKGDAEILIDAGPSSQGKKLVQFLNERGVDDLELIILTHADPEHYGGMSAVLDNFKVGECWWSGRTYEDSNFKQLLNKIKEKNIQLKAVLRGDVKNINDMTLRILNPVEKSFANIDEDAIVIKLSDRNLSILFTSDVLGGGIDDVVKKENITTKILQIPRSGADNIGVWIINLLTESKPESAIISGAYKQDDNKQDIRKPLFNLLKQKNINYFTNYEKGSVRIMSDGVTYNISYIK